MRTSTTTILQLGTGGDTDPLICIKTVNISGIVQSPRSRFSRNKSQRATFKCPGEGVTEGVQRGTVAKSPFGRQAQSAGVSRSLATPRTMAALSGLCPQRRITKGGDSEQFILVGDSYVRADLRDGACLEHLTSFKDTDTRHNWWSSSKSFARVVLIIVFSLMLSTVLFIHGSGVLLLRANHLGRQCLDMRERSHTPRKYHFAMVTCSDGSKTIPHRSFEGLMDLVTPNKQSYVERHGYDFIDASDVLDRNRPPSWSKILAMKKHLPNYEWVFWNDAVCSSPCNFPLTVAPPVERIASFHDTCWFKHPLVSINNYP